MKVIKLDEEQNKVLIILKIILSNEKNFITSKTENEASNNIPSGVSIESASYIENNNFNEKKNSHFI